MITLTHYLNVRLPAEKRETSAPFLNVPMRIDLSGEPTPDLSVPQCLRKYPHVGNRLLARCGVCASLIKDTERFTVIMQIFNQIAIDFFHF